MLNQISTTLVGLAIVFLGGVALLMRPSQRSLDALKREVDSVKSALDALKGEVNSVESDVKTLALNNNVLGLINIVISAAVLLVLSGKSFGPGH